MNRLEVTISPMSPRDFTFNRTFDDANKKLSQATVKKWGFIDGYM